MHFLVSVRVRSDVSVRYRRCHRNYPPYQDKSTTEAWDSFFSDYLRNSLYDLDKKARGEATTGLPRDPKGKEDLAEAKAKLRKAFCSRAFGDGGYLDNKPFSYATAMLMRRRADHVVARKLLYVEPSPEHPELTPEKPPERPDFAQNVRAAVLELPRQEAIREDIERLYERNEMLDRIAIFAAHVDKDMALRNHEQCPAPISPRRD